MLFPLLFVVLIRVNVSLLMDGGIIILQVLSILAFLDSDETPKLDMKVIILLRLYFQSSAIEDRCRLF